MRYYRIIGKEKYTGKFMFTPWYTQETPVFVVEQQVAWTQNMAYDVQVEYSEEVSE